MGLPHWRLDGKQKKWHLTGAQYITEEFCNTLCESLDKCGAHKHNLPNHVWGRCHSSHSKTCKMFKLKENKLLSTKKLQLKIWCALNFTKTQFFGCYKLHCGNKMFCFPKVNLLPDKKFWYVQNKISHFWQTSSWYFNQIRLRYILESDCFLN